MSGVAGLRGTGDWGSQERPTNFREMIQWMQPNGLAPIFGLTSKAAKQSVDDPQFSWWAETLALIRLTVNGTFAAGATTIVVNSADPGPTTMNVNYGTASHLKDGDVLVVEPTTDNAVYNPEFLQVVEALSDTQFTVRRGFAGTTPATINNAQNLMLIGSAYAEGGVAPRAVARNPVKFSNFCQIFKNSYEISGTATQTFARTGDVWSNDKRRKMFDHARDIEMAFIFGQSSENVTSLENGKPIRTMGGLLSQIPAVRKTIFAAPITFSPGANNFLDAVYKVFDFESPAGDTRLCFAGNAALVALQEVAATTTNVRLNSDKILKIYGTDFREFVMPQGRLLIKNHPLLNIQGGIYANSMLILDFASIKYIHMKGRDTRVKDDVQLPDEDVRRGFVQTEASLLLDRGGLTCAYLGNILSH
jgi:uncharacterized protein DUF5309